MKYPAHTNSKPVVGTQAASLVKAVDSGKAFANPQAKATAARLAALIPNFKGLPKNEGKGEVRRS